MPDCIFCRIISGELPSLKVYEDDYIFSFLDINPINPGHTLVIPKNHHHDMISTPDDLVSKLWLAAKKISIAVKTVTNADGINFGVNNGEAAGQDVLHIHIHIIPRFKHDDFTNWPTKKFNQTEAKNIAEQIKNKLK